jgi:hypothetical protein
MPLNEFVNAIFKLPEAFFSVSALGSPILQGIDLFLV